MQTYRNIRSERARLGAPGRFGAALVGALISCLVAAPAMAAPSVWAVDDGEKIKRGATDTPLEQGIDNAVWAPGDAIRLFALRNETVAFQVVVDGDDSGLSDVTVDLERLTGPGGAVLANDPGATDPTRFVGRTIERFVEHYVYIERVSGGPWPGSLGWLGGSPPEGDWTGWVPDALIPVEVAPSWAPYPLQVPAGQNRAIWFDVTVPKGQAPGVYQGQVVVASGGQSVATLPVEVEVHAETLPDWPAKTMLYYNQANLNQSFGWEGAQTARDHLFQLLHRHRITPMHSAHDTSELDRSTTALDGSLYTPAMGYEGPAEGRADDVLAMGVYGGYGEPDGGDLAQVEAIADALAAQGVIDDVDAFVYAIDESCGSSWGQGWQDLLATSSNPNVQDFVDVGWTCSSPAQDQPVDIAMKLASHFDAAEAAGAGSYGKRVWVYNGVQPFSGSMLTDTDAVSLRVNGWLSEMAGIERWFYWSGTFWNDWNNGGLGAYDPFVESETFHNQHGEWANGDGVLVYPGTLQSFPESSVGMNGIIASIRLKNWRRGIQDAGYLQLARAQNPAEADAIATDLIPAALSEATPEVAPSWSASGAAFFDARAALADVIGAAPAPAPAPAPTPEDPADDPAPTPEDPADEDPTYAAVPTPEDPATEPAPSPQDPTVDPKTGVPEVPEADGDERRAGRTGDEDQRRSGRTAGDTVEAGQEDASSGGGCSASSEAGGSTAAMVLFSLLGLGWVRRRRRS
ncbi:MAG: glycoside hydrolase domain-containing protein [Myxococcota bacterium]